MAGRKVLLWRTNRSRLDRQKAALFPGVHCTPRKKVLAFFKKTFIL